jgi:hypothetical protein
VTAAAGTERVPSGAAEETVLRVAQARVVQLEAELAVAAAAAATAARNPFSYSPRQADPRFIQDFPRVYAGVIQGLPRVDRA